MGQGILLGRLYQYHAREWDDVSRLAIRPVDGQHVRGCRPARTPKPYDLRYCYVFHAITGEALGMAPHDSLELKSKYTPIDDTCDAISTCHHRDSGRGVCVNCGTFLEDRT